MVRLTILGGYGEISTIREVFMVRLTMNKNLELFRTTGRLSLGQLPRGPVTSMMQQEGPAGDWQKGKEAERRKKVHRKDVGLYENSHCGPVGCLSRSRLWSVAPDALSSMPG